MRTARILADGIGYYHIILKTTGPLYLFEADSDKADFLDLLERTSRFSGVDVLSFALLDNHFHLFLKVPVRESVPAPEFRLRVEALYGSARAERLFRHWAFLESRGRATDAQRERDRLLARMYDLGEFMKTLKECFQRRYRDAHGWEGSFWRGRYKSILVEESYRAFKALSLYIAMNPVRAGIVKRGTDSRWTSYGLSKKTGTFGWKCHQNLLREIARLAGANAGTDSLARLYDAYIRKAETVSREAVRRKLEEGASLSLYDLLVCRVHAFSNGRALGTVQGLRKLRIAHRRITPMARSTCGLATATWLRGELYGILTVYEENLSATDVFDGRRSR